jgi:hypothetical protein
MKNTFATFRFSQSVPSQSIQMTVVSKEQMDDIFNNIELKDILGIPVIYSEDGRFWPNKFKGCSVVSD